MRSSNPKSLGVLAAMLVCAAAFLGIGAPAASAAAEAGPGWAYSTSFGKIDVSTAEPSHHPIAVDASGNIFAVEQNYAQVKVYNPAGELINVVAQGLVRNVAIDLSDGTLYTDEVVNYGGTSVRRYVSDGKAVPGYTLDPSFELPQGEDIALDQSTGDLLVADPGAGAVRRYDSAGNLLATIATPGINPGWIVAAPDGSIFVAPQAGPDVTHFSGAGVPLATLTAVGEPHGMAFDPVRSVISIAVGNTIKTYSPAGDLVSVVPAHGEGLGLWVDGSADLLYEHNRANVNTYVPVIVPDAEPPVVSSIGHSSAHLEAEVDPGAGPPAESQVHFEYSVDGGKHWTSTPEQNLTDPGATTVEADLEGLLTNSDYEVRVAIHNTQASKVSAAVSFSTPEIAPDVITGNATDISETSAVLNGTINAGGKQTTFHFEYGTTTAYGSRVPATIEGIAGDGRENRNFARTLRGLSPGTTYHYRIVAENALGVTEGSDQTFTTDQPGSVPVRHYEQVTPVDKKGIPVDLEFGFYADADTSAIAYLNKAGEDGAPLHSRSLAVRGSDNWESVSLDPPLNPPDQLWNVVKAVSDDLSHAFVVSNRKLTPSANENGVNLYRYDIASGTYQLVGTTPEQGIMFLYSYLGYSGGYQAGAPDLSWIVFYSFAPLRPGDPYGALYRWSESDGLEVASTLPNGTPESAFSASDSAVSQHPAPADGSRVYFAASGGNPGVYLREGEVTKVVSHPVGEPDSAQPGQFMAASSDGRYAYFAVTVPTALTPDAPGNEGDLYRYDAADGSVEYLGSQTLTPTDHAYALGISDDGRTFYFSGQGGISVWRDGVVRHVANAQRSGNQTFVSPSGRYLAFQGGRGVELYDAQTEELACVSCNPDGSPSDPETTPDESYATLPGEGEERTIGDRFPRVVTDAGQVFYTTAARIVAADVNGKQDVYMYQNGRNSLITPGDGPYDAQMGDISVDGRDVYFATTQRLVGQDKDSEVDIYDARVGGELPVQNPPAPQVCLRDDCKATPNAGPELPFGGSEALSGPGNVNPPRHKNCGKGKRAKKVKGKVRCVKKHSRQRAGKNKKGGNR